MIVRQDKIYEVSELFPNSNFDESRPDNFVVDETTPEGQALAAKIMQFAPHMDLLIENGRLVDVIQTEPVVSLEDAIEKKLAELKLRETEGLQTFKSSALGNEHTYLSEMDDMLLLNGEYSYVKGDDYDGLAIMWYTIEAGNVEHTKEQFVQVYLDARKNVQTVKYHRANLEAQAKAATTVEAVNAIVW